MKQKVSELMDSELGEHAVAQVMTAMEIDHSLRQAWHDYHLIGDVMRANAQANVDVCGRVSARLKAEPTILAPRRWRDDRRVRVAGAAAFAASVSFVAIIAWQQLSSSHHAGAIAGTQQPHPSPHSMVGSNKADDYFLAHQELTADQGLLQASYRRGVAH